MCAMPVALGTKWVSAGRYFGTVVTVSINHGWFTDQVKVQ